MIFVLHVGTVYGEGVYFAVDAITSAKYSNPDTNGYRYMFYCKVLTGEYTVGSHGLKVSPVKNIQTQEWYDSVCHNDKSPSMFIIFDDTQAFPAYLVVFRQLSNSDSTLQYVQWWKPSTKGLNINHFI